jgi:predicted ATPase
VLSIFSCPKQSRCRCCSGERCKKAAAAVAASPELAAPDVIEGLLGLVAKSFVVAGGEGAVARYWLLDTTHAYALEKLDESGDRQHLARRHAEYYRDVFERAEAEWETRPAAEWLADYRPRIDNLRCALDWAFSPEGDASVGLALTAAAPPLWMHLSLMEECRDRVASALAALAAGEDQDARREMKLHAALGASLIFTRGAAVPETGVAWAKALEIAEALGDAEFQLRSLWGLWTFHLNSGRQRVALGLAQKFSIIAASSSEPYDRLLGERMLGVSEHHLGSLPSARLHLERVLAAYVTSDHRHIIRFQIDLRVMARVFLARTLLLYEEISPNTGRVADGLAVIEDAIGRSERGEERWATAELLRIKGELLLLQGASQAATEAENVFRQALDWARPQGALAWELRAATSLTRLLRDQSRPADAMALLQPVYDRFAEGFATGDLKTAKALLDALAEPYAPRTQTS